MAASVDQAILSGLNFFISILLIKNVTKVEYGYYSLAFAISLFLLSIQNAVVNAPLTVLLVTKKDDKKKRYVASLGLGQFLLIIPAVCMGLLSCTFLWQFGFNSTQTAIMAAVSLAAIGLLSREFLRTYFFADEKPLQVLKLDVFYVIFFLAAITLIYFLTKISVPSVFLILGSSGLLVSLYFNREFGWKFDSRAIKESYQENWKYGKWALVGVLVTHVQSYSYLYLLGLFLGSLAVADVSASRLLMMPLLLGQAGWGKIIMPYGSKLRETKQNWRFFKLQVIASIMFVVITITYIAVLMFFSVSIKNFFSEKYANVFNYLILWGIIFILNFIVLNASYGLQVLKKFDIISKLNFITMLVTLALAYYLIQHNGIVGGLMSLIIGDCSLALLLWFYFAKSILFTPKEEKNDFQIFKN
jgi:O-antigen/teichoic acid export membrane protein